MDRRAATLVELTNLSAAPAHGDSVLRDACRRGDVTSATKALTRGANASSRDSDGETPLHAAALGGHSRLVELLL